MTVKVKQIIIYFNFALISHIDRQDIWWNLHEERARGSGGDDGETTSIRKGL